MSTTDATAMTRSGGLDFKSAASTLSLLALAYYSIKIFKALWIGFTGPLNKIPGPWLNRVTGLPWMIEVIKGKAFERSAEYIKQYGDIVRVGPDLIIVSDAESVRQVLVGMDLRKSVVYERFRQDPDAPSLFTIRDRADYRTRRRFLSNGFSVSYLKGLEPLMIKCIKVLEEHLDEQCALAGGKAIVDAWSLNGRIAFDIMSETAFGGSFEMVRNGEHPIRKRFSITIKRMSMYQLLPFLKYVPFMPPFQDRELRRLVDEIIDRRRSTGDKIGKPDILQLLLDAHDENPEQYNEKILIAEMFMFLVAGGETSGSTLTFALMLLLNHPDAYEKVVREVRERFPDTNSPVTDEKTADLPFLTAVLKETLRLMPPGAAGLYRQADEDIILGDRLIPAGTRITAQTTVLQLDEKEWPDADKFVPERWLYEYKGKTANEKAAWYPFSAGSRNCIGKQFAWTELRLVLASVLRRYDLFLIPDQSHEVVHFTVLHLKAGKYMIGIKPKA